MKAITWNGNGAVPESALDKLLQLHQGEVADRSKLDGSIDAIRKTYQSAGYLAVKIQPLANFSDTDHLVAYDIKLTEGDLFHMGNVTMQGLDPSVLQKLQKNWKLSRGEAYNAEYLQSFLKKNSALFSENGRGRTVKVQQMPHDKVVDVAIDF